MSAPTAADGQVGAVSMEQTEGPAVAKHAWLRQVLRQEVAERMAPHEMLPPERELAARFEVSRMTIRQALRALTDDGLIYAVRGVGTFVTEPKVSKDLALSSFSEDMRARGLRPGSRLIAAEAVEADAATAKDLGIEPGAAAYRIERLRSADDIPVAHEQAYLPARLFPKLLEQDLDGSLYDLMERRYRIRVERAQQTTSAVNLGKHLADLLGVPARTAALHVRRIGIDSQGRIVERADTLYRGDRYDFSATIRRVRR
ncbi:GntR family transcriptional regulator [Hamadaea tsunoensis]|uniref:GntR family transcriptional regulator n=1 Tax=Hamadaea tsunoensis TaxID=53368 RepID=UPI00041ACAED|nr:GntR family transcriptional regulator [Hamadaea tsunoensis]